MICFKYASMNKYQRKTDCLHKKMTSSVVYVIYNLPLCYRQGLLDGEIVRTIFRAHNVPLPDDLLRAALSM